MMLTSLFKKNAIGQLRHHIQLERAVVMDDGAGGGIRSWQAITDAWARIEPIAMTHDNAERKAAQIITHRIVMRWRNDVDSSCRIVWGPRIFLIHAVADGDERRRFLVALTEEARP